MYIKVSVHVGKHKMLSKHKMHSCTVFVCEISTSTHEVFTINLYSLGNVACLFASPCILAHINELSGQQHTLATRSAAAAAAASVTILQ